MQPTLLGYKLIDLLIHLEPYTAKFRPDFLRKASFSSQLNRFTVINTLVSHEKPNGQPLPGGMLLKIVSAVLYEEPVDIPIIPDILTASFGMSADGSEPLILLEGDVYRDKVNFFIFSELKLTLDLTHVSLVQKMRKTGTFTYERDNTPFVFPVLDRALKIRMNPEEGFEFLDPDQSGNPPFHVTDFPPVMIANTGFVIEFDKVTFKGGFDDPCLTCLRAYLVPPASMELPGSIPFPRIEAETAILSSKGLSGNFTAVWDLRFNEEAPAGTNPFSYHIENTDHPATFFGTGDQALKGGFSKMNFRFVRNQFVEGMAMGKMLIPYFDTPVDIELHFEANGSCSIQLTAADEKGLVLTKEQLIELHVKKLGFVRKPDGSYFFQISGGLQPLLYSNEGMKWPLLELDNFTIDSTGTITFREAMLDLQQPAALDLFGFHVELKKIGLGMLGNGDQQKLWLELAGGLKLIEQLPLGLDLEGFRVIWPRNLRYEGAVNPQNLLDFARQFEIQFKGLEISYAIPGSLQLDGMVRFIKEGQTTGFAGDMVLIIPPSGIRADAGLLVGMNKSQPGPFPFFYVYFGLEAAAGIPLGSSGLALKGAMGLFGINVSPNRKQGENWYHDWYKKAPGPGAHQTTKWSDERNAMAVGAGLTITTADGIIKGTKGILVLSFPGPVLVINGQALLFQGLNPAAEPPFSITAIFDGKEQIAQFNLEAQAEIVKDLVEAEAGVELYFDFKDATKWHLYLGEDRPAERRIQANLLKSIEANAYLMLDMLDADSPRARMGLQASSTLEMDPLVLELPFGNKAEIRFSASYAIEGNGTVAVNPDHFSGDAGLSVEGELSVFRFAIGFAAGVDIAVEGPAPFSLKGTLDVEADLPGALPDFATEYDFEFTIPKVALTFEDPLKSISLFNRFSSQSPETPIRNTANRISESFDPETKSSGEYVIPYVECDSLPVLLFDKEMNMQSADMFYMYPGGLKYFDMGALKIKPVLEKIVIREREKRTGAPWQVLFSTDPADQKKLSGHWMVESDPASPGRPASRRLMLMNRNPFTGTVHATDTIGGIFPGFPAADQHLSARLLDDFGDLICAPAQPEKNCVFFRFPGKALSRRSFEWSGLTLASDEIMTITNPCLSATDDILVSFPEKVLSAEITFCDMDGRPAVDIVTPGRLKSRILDRPVIAKKPKPGIKDIGRIGQAVDRPEGNTITVRSATAFSRIRIRKTEKKGTIRIQSVCYALESTQQDNQVNQLRCSANRDLLRDALQQQLLRPDRVYEIEIRSRQELTVVENRADNPFILQQYREIQAPAPVTKYAYFQTGNPPQQLAPYVKWSKPAMGMPPVFTDQPLVIRFMRGYISQLYSPEKMKLYLIHPEQQDPVELTDWQWSRAAAATLFPDEETVSQFLSANAVVATPLADDILLINTRGIPGYHPDKQYELLITCPDALNRVSGNPAAALRKIHSGTETRVVAYSFVFRTSKTASLKQLLTAVGAGRLTAVPGSMIAAGVVNGTSVTFPSAQQQLLLRWNASRKLAYLMAADYRFGLAKYDQNGIRLTGKEALEKANSQLRDVADQLTKLFQQTALAIQQDLYFRAAPRAMTIDCVKTAGERIRYIWIRFPSAFELKVIETGELSVNIQTPAGKLTLEANALFDAAGSQVIFDLGKEYAPSELKGMTLVLSNEIYNSDDQAGDGIFGNNQRIHHRYDRPSGTPGSNLSLKVTLDL